MNTEMKESKQNAKETGGKSVLSRVVKYVTAAAVLLVLFWFGFTCQIREGECGVILRFGAVRKEVTDAGLYMKLPWPFESVVKYDARKQYLESNKLETTTKDKRNVILQSFVVWSVADPVVYHNSVGTQGSVESYIKDQVFSATNSTLGAYNLTALVSLEKKRSDLTRFRPRSSTGSRKNARPTTESSSMMSVFCVSRCLIPTWKACLNRCGPTGKRISTSFWPTPTRNPTGSPQRLTQRLPASTERA